MDCITLKVIYLGISCFLKNCAIVTLMAKNILRKVAILTETVLKLFHITFSSFPKTLVVVHEF